MICIFCWDVCIVASKKRFKCVSRLRVAMMALVVLLAHFHKLVKHPTQPRRFAWRAIYSRGGNQGAAVGHKSKINNKKVRLQFFIGGLALHV